MGEGIIVRRGGGANLNYKVVFGTSAPSSPSENMIWVNTPTEITSHVFSTTQPTSPAAGMVWFKTDTASAVPMNILKKNALWVYPTNCQQYQDGAWVTKVALTYQGGEWVPWEIWLYNFGNECTDLTGGWKGYAYKTANSGSSVAAPTVTKGTDTISVKQKAKSGSTYYAGALFTENPIDLTPYSVLKINVTAVAGDTTVPKLSISPTKANNYTESAKVSLSTVGVQEIDISSITGEHYVVIRIEGPTNATTVAFNKIWLI